MKACGKYRYQPKITFIQRVSEASFAASGVPGPFQCVRSAGRQQPDGAIGGWGSAPGNDVGFLMTFAEGLGVTAVGAFGGVEKRGDEKLAVIEQGECG